MQQKNVAVILVSRLYAYTKNASVLYLLDLLRLILYKQANVMVKILTKALHRLEMVVESPIDFIESTTSKCLHVLSISWKNTSEPMRTDPHIKISK